MFTKLYQKYPRLVPVLVLLTFACLLASPYLFLEGLTLKHDFLFHFNRFYEAAAQIREGDFSYFISVHGYQQAGRVVNALYGPLFAYLQGAALLLAGSWYSYHILSNVALAFLAGLALYGLMKEAQIRTRIALPFSLLFMTTYAIQYWWLAQGFSSWGVAVYTGCLLVAIRTLRTGRVNSLLLGMSVAAMFQTHMLSSFFLVLTYVPIYAFAFFRSQEKLVFFKKALLALPIFFGLTLNIWLTLAHLYGSNKIASPFVNADFALDTITGNQISYLLNPLAFSILILLGMVWFYQQRRTLPAWVKVLGAVALGLLILSTNLIPWQFLVDQDFAILDLIQFPFRFYFYATPLLLLLLAYLLQNLGKKSLIFVYLCLAVSAGQTIYRVSDRIQNDFHSSSFLDDHRHTRLTASKEDIRQSMFSDDLASLLQMAEKSTPDYVPLYRGFAQDKGISRYKLYRTYIIDGSDGMTKSLNGDQIVLEWEQETEGDKALPVLVYAGTRLNLNGQTLQTDAYQLSRIGSPTIQAKAGKNRLIVSYERQFWLIPSLAVTGISWLASLAFYARGRRREVQHEQVS